MRKSTIVAVELFVILVCALAMSGAARIEKTSTETVDHLLNAQSTTYHRWNDDEYLTRRRFQPQGGIALAVYGDSVLVRNTIALFDSIANGTGTWADSVRVRIRATVFIDPDSTRATRAGDHMTIGEVQQVVADYGQSVYEIGTTTSSRNAMGWRGVVNAAQPSYAGNVVMGRDFVLDTFQAFQDSAASWGIDGFRTHRWRDDKYQMGISDLIRQRGYYQAFRMATPVTMLQTEHDAFETYSEDAPNFWQFPSASYARGGNQRTVGLHGIGEGVSDFNLGFRPWQTVDDTNAGGDADSLKMFVDLAATTLSMGGIIFDGTIGDSTSAKDIAYANFRSFASHLAHRVDEGLVETLTVEQLAARKRGIRRGEFLPHRGFTVLCADTSYTNGAIASNLTGGGAGNQVNQRSPIGWPQSEQQWAAATDTLSSPGVVNGIHPTVWRLSVDGDSITAAYQAKYGDADSVSYGLAGTNVIYQRWNSTSIMRPFCISVVTMGSDARAVEITGQFIICSPVTFAADSFYVAYKFNQASERWDDYMNEGPSAYQTLQEYASFRLQPDTSTTAGITDSMLTKQRIEWQTGVPYFAFADTTTTGYFQQMLGGAAAQTRWAKDFLWRKTTWRLSPALRGTQGANDWDYQSSLGNPRSDGSLHAIEIPEPVNHETLRAHLVDVTEYGRLYGFRIVVERDDNTDYVVGHVSIDSYGGTVSAAPLTMWTNFGARGI